MPKPKPADAEAPAERTVAIVDQELATWRAEAEAARADIASLKDRRQAALLTATVEEIAGFDMRAAMATARIDKAEAFIAMLGGERASLHAAADLAQRRANAVRDAELVREAKLLLEEDYAAAAAHVVAVLDRLAAIEDEVAVLNLKLPAGQVNLSAQAFRGLSRRFRVVDSQGAPTLVVPRSLLAAVSLPALVVDEANHWPKGTVLR